MALGGFDDDKLAALPDGRIGNEAPGRGKESSRLQELTRSSNSTPSSRETVSKRSLTGSGVTTASSESDAAIPSEKFAFPAQRKQPLENASHVRNAVARFNQVEGVSDADRDAAWLRVRAAAGKFGVELHEDSWREIGGKRAAD